MTHQEARMPIAGPAGIVRYATYLPPYRVQRTALGGRPARGARIVAGFDEDSTTMAVEAARSVVSHDQPSSLYLATTSPAYWHKTNATAVHAALALDESCFAVDMAGSPRSAIGALRAAASAGGLAVLSDVVVGLPGSTEETGGRDGAAAFLFGAADDALAIVVGQASATAEFLDRWALPGDERIRRWEERFGADRYRPLVAGAGARALEQAGIGQADHVVVSSPHVRAAAEARKAFVAAGDHAAPDPGYAGAADLGLRLAATLDSATAGATILVLSIVDGCDAWVLRVTERIDVVRSGAGPGTGLEDAIDVPYLDYLSWRGQLRREPPRRPDPDRPYAPPSARSANWKFGFSGARCDACGFVHLPPVRVCKGCGAVDEMTVTRIADRKGTIATFTVDRLAYSPAPPVIDVVVDFEGGGRAMVEMTGIEPEELQVGTAVRMAFRTLYTVDGTHNYFWKARPAGARCGAANGK